MSMIGKSLAHYEITAEIGRGGMGEVYQAKDKKLGRDVAIKVLPEEFAQDIDRVTRFQREAKLLASLNHPNIAAIHGLEESDGTHFLILELIEGQTLADRIKSSPIPVEEALKLALQITEALEAAHEKGVIHRDLKPANIKITSDGKVKVLDFGLAKAYAGSPEDINLSNSPTLSDAATRQGVILGTAAYMAPEQARGTPVDKRADIWAFGVVLFEMLTGRQLFSENTISDTMASVLKTEPPWQSLPPNLHPRIRFLLERCLKKDPRNRYSGISDARVEIQEVLADPGGVFARPAGAAEPKAKSRRALPWVAAGALACILVGAVVWHLRAPEPHRVVRFDYEFPEGQNFTGVLAIDVSPDGQTIAYSTNKGLFLRSVDELAPKLIAGAEEGARQPFFSPDGKWVGFISQKDNQLKKVSVNGGTPVKLCDIGGGVAGASWNADDTILYGHVPSGIMQVPGGGGVPESVEKTSILYMKPRMLPNGKSLLVSRLTPQQILAFQFESGEMKELMPGFLAGYLPTGYLVYWPPDDNTLFAVPFDPDKLEIAGDPFPLVENVGYAAISDSGTLAYHPAAPSQGAPSITLVWVDREGKEEPLGTPPNSYGYPKISPDGTQIALSVGNFPDLDIWTWDAARRSLSRLTFEKTREMTPVWSPDGKRIAYWADTAGGSPNGLYVKAADGTGEAEKLISAVEDRQLHFGSWSRDGKSLLLQEMVTWTNFDISVVSMEGDHAKSPLLETEYSETGPEISPDGRWVAYESNESQRVEIYVRPFPDVGKGKWQVSTGGGNSPLWAPDMRELYYLSEDSHAMVVSVETEPAIRFGTPKVLFENTNLGPDMYTGKPWDLHPDGRRFLMMKREAATASEGEAPKPRITIVLNWFEELKKRLPAK